MSWAHEPQAYHSDHFPKFLRERMLNKGIVLSSTFFNMLEEQIKKLANPLNDHSSINMLIEIFKKSKKFGSINELGAFKECLNEINKERDLENHNNSSKRLGG